MSTAQILALLGCSAGTLAAQGTTHETRGPSDEEPLERRTWVMGTVLSVRVPGERAHAIAASEALVEAVRRVDALLSTWSGKSEIARVNQAPLGSRTALSPKLDSLLSLAFRLADSTQRTFDPTVGALVDAFGLRGTGRIPDSTALRHALAATGPGALVYADRTIVRRLPAAWIDTDGFGKGAALRAAALALAKKGVKSALLNFGGQVLAIGLAPDGDPWEIPVADPRDRRRPAATLRLRDLSAATSAQSERGVEIAGTWVGHVLDPRTGRPVAAWGSVTVVHADPLTADALSTALFVMGPDDGLHWAETHEVAALFLMHTPAGLVVRATTGLADRVAGATIGG